MRKRSSVVLFLTIFVGILSLGITVVFEALALAFSIDNPTQLLYLASTLALFTLSFVAASVLGNFYYNHFTRVFYLLAASWIGFFTYLFIASLVYVVAILISPSFVAIGPLLFLSAFLLSIYGIVHARNIVTARITVSLPNLPPAWKGRAAAWISDVHLGQLYGHDYTEKIAARINALSPDIIFVGGDLYDGTSAPDMMVLTAPLRKLSAKLGVYFITGNHEEYGNLKQFLTAVESVGMHVLKDELRDIDGLQIIGVDYHNASNTTQFGETLKRLSINRDRPSILLKHDPRDLDVAESAGISLQISGHTHNAQMWPLNYIGDRIHKGFAYGLKPFKKMQVYTSSGTGTWGPPMRVGTDCEIVLFTFI